jgi:hypothetical protein
MGAEAARTSAGSVAFAAIVRRRGGGEVGRELGMSPGAVRNIAAGRRGVGGTARRAIAATYKIPEALWDQPAAPPGKPHDAPAPSAAPLAPPPPPGRSRRASSTAGKPSAPPPADDETSDPQVLALRVVRQLERELAAAKGNEAYTPKERAALATATTGALRLLARLSGSLEVTQTAITRSAAWSRIMRAFEAVFSRHPECAQACAEFARALEDIAE